MASSYIVSRLLRAELTLTGENSLNHPNLIAIGSILHWADSHSFVWGSGFISSEIGLRSKPAKVVAVRGHLTRERLVRIGIRAPLSIGDPGILISQFFRPTDRTRRGVGIIPHYVDKGHPFVTQALEHGAILIDPLSPLESYLTAIASCEAVISSSLHGLVFAHSYRIPAAWVNLSDRVIGDGFKFRDYYSSIGFSSEEIPNLTGTDSFERIVGHVSLPKSEIDRDALRDALVGVMAQLLE